MKICSSKNILLFLLVFSLNVFTLFCEGTEIDIDGDECINQEFAFPWGGDYLEACLAFGCRRVRDHKSWYRFWNRKPEYLHVNANGNEQVTQCIDCEGFIKKGPLFGGMLICTPAEMGGNLSTPKGWVSLATGSLRISEVIKKKSSLKLIPNNWRINGDSKELNLDLSKCSSSGENSITTLSIIVTVTNILNDSSKLPKYRKKLRLLSEDINVRIKTLNYDREEPFENDFIDDTEDEIQYDNTDEYTLFDNSKFSLNQGETIVPSKKQLKTKKKIFSGAERLPRGWKLSSGQTSIYSSSDVVDIEVAQELHPNELVQVILTCNNKFMDCNIQDFVSCFNIMCKSITKDELIRRTALKKAKQFISDSIAKGETKPIMTIPQFQSGIHQIGANIQPLNQLRFKQSDIVGGTNPVSPGIIHIPVVAGISGNMGEKRVGFGSDMVRPMINILSQSGSNLRFNGIGMPPVPNNFPVIGKPDNLICGYKQQNNSSQVHLSNGIANKITNYTLTFPTSSFGSIQHQNLVNYPDESEESQEVDDILLPTNTNTISSGLVLGKNTFINGNQLNTPSVNIIKCAKPVAKIIKPIASGIVITGNTGGNIYRCSGTDIKNTTSPDTHLNISNPNILNVIPINSINDGKLLKTENCIKVVPMEATNLQIPVKAKSKVDRVKELKIVGLKRQEPKVIEVVRKGVIDVPVEPKIILIKEEQDENASLVERKADKYKIPIKTEKVLIKNDVRHPENLLYGTSRIVIPKKADKGKIVIGEVLRNDTEFLSIKEPKKIILLENGRKAHPRRTKDIFIDRVLLQKYIPPELDVPKRKHKKILLVKNRKTGIESESEVFEINDNIPRRVDELYILDKDSHKRRKGRRIKEYTSYSPSEDSYSTIILKKVDEPDNVGTDELSSKFNFDNTRLESRREQRNSEIKDKHIDDNREQSEEESSDYSPSESQNEKNYISTKTNLETKKIGKSILGYSIFTAITLFIFFIFIRLFLL
ncbi:hypothetical protein FG379_003143 [Cryptosporidium bovis]|uniref:uncharacterized protein n=1 Tax=Cryptosporidium bovis TaxID=310047 RepID=UPI00351AACFA|nr:hypothetical protein FG379_003143 [Cryptosporidium bovis]